MSEKSEDKKKKEPKLADQIQKQLMPMLALMEQKIEARLSVELKPLDARFMRFESQLNGIKEQIEFLKDDSRLKSIEQSVRSMLRDFGDFQNKMNGLDEMPGKLEEEAAKRVALVAQIDSMSGFPQMVEANKAALMKLEKAMSEIQPELDKLVKHYDQALHDMKERIEQKSASSKEQLAMFGERSEEMKAKLSEMEAAQGKDHDGLMQKIAGLAADIERSARQQDIARSEMVKRMDSFEPRMEQRLKDMVGQYKQKIEDCLQRIDFAEMQGKRLQRLEVDSDKHDQMLKHLLRSQKD